MSKPMMRSTPARRLVSMAPTIPPAGPDSSESLASSRAASVSPPLDCITSSGAPPSSEVTAAT